MTDLQLVPDDTPARQDLLITWILRVSVTVVFCAIGWSKFETNSMWVRLFEQIGFGQWFRYFTGIVQIAGAVLVLVPRTFVVGIALLACTMAGAVAIWIVRFGAVGNAIIPAVVLVGLVGVGVHGAGVSRRAAPGTDRRAGGL